MRTAAGPRTFGVTASVALLFLAMLAPALPAEAPEVSNVDFEEVVRTGGQQVVTFTISGADASNISRLGVLWDTVSHAGGGLDASRYRNRVTVEPEEDGEYVVRFGAPLDGGTVHFVVHAVIDGEDHYGGDREHSFEVNEPPALDLGTGLLVALLLVVFVAGTGMLALSWRARGRREGERGGGEA